MKFNDEEEKIIDKVLNSLPNEIGMDTVKYESHTMLSFPNLKIDMERQIIKKYDKEFSITHTEFEILCLLASNLGQVFSREQIYDHVWHDSYSGCSKVIVSHIRHIREKIEDVPGQPVYIQTVWGVGYRFNKNIGGGS